MTGEVEETVFTVWDSAWAAGSGGKARGELRMLGDDIR